MYKRVYKLSVSVVTDQMDKQFALCKPLAESKQVGVGERHGEE